MSVIAMPGPRIDWKTERDRIDLAAVATHLLGPASKRRGESGRKLWWNCPFHEDQNPSFCIDPGKPWWKCWGCGESGDAANLVMRLESMTFPEAVFYLTGGSKHSGKLMTVGPKSQLENPLINGEIKPEIKDETKGKSKKSKFVKNHYPETTYECSGMSYEAANTLILEATARLWSSEGREALAYLTGPDRCLSVETIRAARLGWTSWVDLPKANGTTFRALGWVIPWFVGPRLALVKIRQPDGRKPKYAEAFRDPSRLVCYPGPATIRPGRPLVVVEGEFDALAVGEALGDLAAVVTLGSASSEPTPAILGQLLAAAPWYIAMDNDNAGGLAAAKWEAYGRARRVRLPPRYKDWTEAKADGVNLARWWSDLISGQTFHRDARGDMAPELFTDQEAAGWRWGPTFEDDLSEIPDPFAHTPDGVCGKMTRSG